MKPQAYSSHPEEPYLSGREEEEARYELYLREKTPSCDSLEARFSILPPEVSIGCYSAGK